MPSSPDIERLRALASAATQGERTAFFKSKYDEWHVGMPFDNPGSTKWALFDDGIQSERPEHDAKFIAACDPQTIISLIDVASEAEALRADAARWQYARKHAAWAQVADKVLRWVLILDMPPPCISKSALTEDSVAIELDAGVDAAIAASKPASAKGGE